MYLYVTQINHYCSVFDPSCVKRIHVSVFRQIHVDTGPNEIRLDYDLYFNVFLYFILDLILSIFLYLIDLEE